MGSEASEKSDLLGDADLVVDVNAVDETDAVRVRLHHQ